MQKPPSPTIISDSPINAPAPRRQVQPGPKEWLALVAIVVFGGSSFGAIRVAVETAEPAIVASGRLWVAAVILMIYTAQSGRHLPPVLRAGGFSRTWTFAAVVGAVGYTLPMFLFPYAQQTVSSMLAGIYMAAMPIITFILAALFSNERLTIGKIVGSVIGFAGVIALIGPAALGGVLTQNLLAQICLLVATTGYAVAAVITRNAPDVAARAFAAATLTCAAVFSTPVALETIQISGFGVSPESLLAILYLGIFPTAINAILIIFVVKRIGAGFMSLSNYITPAVAVGIGALAFGEVIETRHLVGLAVILVGVSVVQPSALRAALNALRGSTAAAAQGSVQSSGQSSGPIGRASKGGKHRTRGGQRADGASPTEARAASPSAATRPEAPRPA